MNGFYSYLKQTNQNFTDFSHKINKPAETVRRWANGISVPQGENMSLVIKATNHQVTPNDFYTEAE